MNTATPGWTWPVPSLVSGRTYIIKTRAKDRAGNEQDASGAGFTFLYDITLPTTAVTFPTHNAKLNFIAITLSGTAADYPTGGSLTNAGINSVRFILRRVIDTKYWTVLGEDWVGLTENQISGAGAPTQNLAGVAWITVGGTCWTPRLRITPMMWNPRTIGLLPV